MTQARVVGLDKPLFIQYVDSELFNFLTGNISVFLADRQPVLEIISQTVELDRH